GERMSNRVRKAVFPAGGLGTRFLPATKVIPKEMLALVDKPIIQYGVEEALASGIEHIIIVTGRGKYAIEDHFDFTPELDANPPCLKQMIGVFNERSGSVLATMTIEGSGISAYGVLAGSPDSANPRIYNCTGMVEKPKLEDAPSKQAIIGRYVLTPRIFALLEQTQPGAGGEIQLTDGIKALLKEEKVFGYTFEGKRYDAGDKFGMLQATVEFALKRPEFSDNFRAYLKSLSL